MNKINVLICPRNTFNVLYKKKNHKKSPCSKKFIKFNLIVVYLDTLMYIHICVHMEYMEKSPIPHSPPMAVLRVVKSDYTRMIGALALESFSKSGSKETEVQKK